MTGFSVSVLRSLLQRHLSHFKLTGMSNLGLSILLMFLLDYHFLLTIGGVLSFSYAFLLMQLSSIEKKTLIQNGFASLGLSLMILPLLMMIFSSFNPLSLPLTVFFSLIFNSLILPLLCLAFSLSPFLKLDFLNFLFRLLE